MPNSYPGPEIPRLAVQNLLPDFHPMPAEKQKSCSELCEQPPTSVPDESVTRESSFRLKGADAGKRLVSARFQTASLVHPLSTRRKLERGFPRLAHDAGGGGE